MAKTAKLMPPLVVTLMSVAGCVSSTNYASVQEAMKGSPELVEKMVDDCVSTYRGSSKEKEYLSKLARVPNDERLPKVLCARAYKGISTGRITYEDFQSMSSGQVKPVVIRVLQNR